MKKFYFILLFLFIISSGVHLHAQEEDIQSSEDIEGLSIYPNPTSSRTIYITSKFNLTKQVEIFDVFGNRIFFRILTARNGKLDISALKEGVYIIKIKEKDQSASRKLVIS